jgi:transposase
VREASEILKMSYRQCRRKYKRYKEKGDEGLVHLGRGKASNRKYGDETKTEVIKKYQERYWDFGPTLAAEKLGKSGHKIDHETLRRWLIREGIWQKGRKRAKHRSWRPRRSHFGELVQMDGSHHEWFEDRAGPCCLMNMVDDATGETLSLFDEQETTRAAMSLLWMWIDKYGIPAALYTDRKNVYVPDENAVQRAELRGEECLTQFGRACKELGITIIEAHSPQAKGRVERSNGVYQDRLVKEMRLEGISDIEPANRFLAGGFLEDLNAKFKVDPAEKADFHRSKKGYDLKENEYYQVQQQSKCGPASRKVKVRRYLDGELHINYRGRDVSYTRLPTRPAPSAKKQSAKPSRASSTRKKRPYSPKPEHPWRKTFKKSKRPVESAPAAASTRKG